MADRGAPPVVGGRRAHERREPVLVAERGRVARVRDLREVAARREERSLLACRQAARPVMAY